MKTSIATIMSAGDMSGNVTSDPFRLENMVTYAIQAVFSGTAPTGTFKLQASNDVGNDPGTGASNISGLTNWTDIASSSQAVSANGNVMWNVSDPGYKWVRMVYTRTSGSGTCTATASAKGRA